MNKQTLTFHLEIDLESENDEQMVKLKNIIARSEIPGFLKKLMETHGKEVTRAKNSYFLAEHE